MPSYLVLKVMFLFPHTQYKQREFFLAPEEVLEKDLKMWKMYVIIDLRKKYREKQ